MRPGSIIIVGLTLAWAVYLSSEITNEQILAITIWQGAFIAIFLMAIKDIFTQIIRKRNMDRIESKKQKGE